MAKLNNKYNWNLTDIYKDLDAWEKDFSKVKANSDFSEFKGKLGQKEVFYKCSQKEKEVFRVLDKLALYAMLVHDEDTSNSLGDGLYSRVMALSSSLSANTSYILPELTALDESVIKGYILDPELSDNDYALKSILKSKKHVLSEKEEKLLALSGEVFAGFRDIFSKIDNADLDFGKINFNGEKIELSHGTYGVLMHQTDRALRKKAFKQYYKEYIGFINTISSTYAYSVKRDVLSSKVRNYESALDMALINEDVDKSVYENLISCVGQALPSLHKYMKVKAQMLGLEKLHMYDIYAPILEDVELKLDYEQAYDMVMNGLSVLGEDYVELLRRAKDEGWIDVYEKKGKRSGAYSAGVYDTHPYVLLNYQPTTHDVFTIAHEMGHSIHTYYSNKNQPYEKADYKIFVAEVASTVNEVLLIRYLLKTRKDKKLKKYLLSYLMDMIRTTLFRQTQFAEFEYFSHVNVEKGIPLTKESMCKEYLKLNKKYYGKWVVSDKEIEYEWARIPHFYRAFYVYKYATGIISALSIADRILNEGEKAKQDYFKFLSSGGSDSPVQLLKIAGVDLTSTQPFKKAFKIFEDTLNEFISIE